MHDNDMQNHERKLIEHLPQPGPDYWSWRCLLCGEPVEWHISYWTLTKDWLWRRGRTLQQRVAAAVWMILLWICASAAAGAGHKSLAGCFGLACLAIGVFMIAILFRDQWENRRDD